MGHATAVAPDMVGKFAMPVVALPTVTGIPSHAEMSQPIPEALLQLLSQAWQRTGGVSEFEQGLACAASQHREYSHADTEENANSAFSYREIESLRAAGLLDGLARGPSGALTVGVQLVDVHAEHAIADFCAEVYDAWDRLQRRLEAARAVAARSAIGED